MELELKHIIPFADHGIRVLVTPGFGKSKWYGRITDIDIRTNSVKIQYTGKRKIIWKYYPLSNIKPILHPLPDLLREIEHNGKKFTPVKSDILSQFWDEEYQAFYFDDELSGNITIMEIPEMYGNFPHMVIEWLYQHHFDVSGLIPEKLAIAK